MASAVIILLLISAAWGAFLLPEVLNSRKDAPISTTRDFTRWSNTVAGVQTSRQPAASGSGAVARRRRALIILFALAIGSLALAIWQASMGFLLLHVAIDAIVAWYVAMLVQMKQRRLALEAITPVRPASEPIAQIESGPSIRIVASG